MLYSWSAENDLLTLSSTFSTSSSSYNVAYTHTFTPAHQWATSAISNAAWRYTPAALTLSYGAANGLNQVSAFNTTALHWDANGNYVGSAAGFEVYDAENRLMASGTTGAYAYDPLGRRSMTTFSGTQTNFVHDGDSEIAEYDASNNLLRRFVPGAAIDEYVAMVTGSGTKTFFHTDKMGSVVAMSDVNGNLAEGPYLYDAYGRCFNAGGSTCAAGEPFRYTGQRDDLPTNTYYYRARYYSPILGIFFQTDPVGYKDNLNAYSYVGDDPTDRTDPTGEKAQPMTGCFDIGDCFAISGKAGQKKNTSSNGQNAPIRVANAEDAPGERDAEGEVGATAREIVRNDERADERDREEARNRESEREAEATRSKAAGKPPRIEVDLPRINLTRTVESKLESRPFLNSALTAREIMSTGVGKPDPGGLPNAVRYDVQGSFNGSPGTYELVINPSTGLIYHFMFEGY